MSSNGLTTSTSKTNPYPASGTIDWIDPPETIDNLTRHFFAGHNPTGVAYFYIEHASGPCTNMCTALMNANNQTVTGTFDLDHNRQHSHGGGTGMHMRVTSLQIVQQSTGG